MDKIEKIYAAQAYAIKHLRWDHTGVIPMEDIEQEAFAEALELAEEHPDYLQYTDKFHEQLLANITTWASSQVVDASCDNIEDYFITYDLERPLLRDDLERFIHKLPPKQAMVVRYRYGLVDGHRYSRKEIAEAIGCTYNNAIYSLGRGMWVLCYELKTRKKLKGWL